MSLSSAPSSAAPRWVGRLVAASLLAVGLLTAGLAGTASAHVSVTASSSEPGGYSVLSFRVPNESDTASTTEVQVDLPAETVFTSVQTRTVPGWSAELVRSELAEPIVDSHGTEITEAVTTIIWRAEGDNGIAPGQFGVFDLSVGPLPETEGTLHLPTVQIYDDGSTAEWVQQAEGDAEPEHPAPSFEVGAGDVDTTHGSGGTAESTQTADPVAEDSAAGPGTALGIAALVVALAAAALAGVAVVRTRR